MKIRMKHITDRAIPIMYGGYHITEIISWKPAVALREGSDRVSIFPEPSAVKADEELCNLSWYGFNLLVKSYMIEIID